ncbi:MAG: zinc-dependent alcohol dehydrogenase [Anaerolineae bacterium]
MSYFKMLGLRFTGHKGLYLGEFPKPQAKGTEVVVKVMASAICGSDREVWEGEGQKAIPGHESSGQVVEVDRPTWVRVGDRVAINCHVTCGHCIHCLNGDLYFCPELSVIGIDRNGGNAEYVLVPESSCMPLPDDVSYEAGALLVDMLGTSYRAVKRLNLLPGDTVGIFGAGPIGLAALLVAKRYGMRVVLIDLNAYRLDMARRLGADEVFDPLREDVLKAIDELTAGMGLDAALECIGAEATTRQALEAVKKRGTVALVGVSTRVTVNPWEQFIKKEVTMFGSRNFNVREYWEMVALVQRGLPIEDIVTHRFSLERAEEAFAVFGSGQCGKVIIQP